MAYQGKKLSSCNLTLHVQAEKNGCLDAFEGSMRPVVAAAASGVSSPRYRSSLPESPKTARNFFEILTSSSIKVQRFCF